MLHTAGQQQYQETHGSARRTTQVLTDDHNDPPGANSLHRPSRDKHSSISRTPTDAAAEKEDGNNDHGHPSSAEDIA